MVVSSHVPSRVYHQLFTIQECQYYQFCAFQKFPYFGFLLMSLCPAVGALSPTIFHVIQRKGNNEAIVMIPCTIIPKETAMSFSILLRYFSALFLMYYP